QTGTPTLLVTDNDTNDVELFGTPSNPTQWTKDGIDAWVVGGRPESCHVVAPGVEEPFAGPGIGSASPPGTKAAAWYHFDTVAPGQSVTVRLRLVAGDGRAEADDFHAGIATGLRSDEQRQLLRRALAGLMWTKQHYRFRVRDWLEGDPAQPRPPQSRLGPGARNARWRHMDVADVILMPDEWEYPWFAAWD